VSCLFLNSAKLSVGSHKIRLNLLEIIFEMLFEITPDTYKQFPG